MNSPVWLAGRREVTGRVRRRSFLVFTGLLCALIVGVGVLSAVLRDDSRPSYDVAVVVQPDAMTDLESALVAAGDAQGVDIDVAESADSADARQALTDGEVDAIVDVAEQVVLWHHAVNDELSTVLAGGWASWSAVTAASDAGLDHTEIEMILSPPPLSNDVVEPDDDADVAVAVGLSSAVLLFMSITTFGGNVLTGVVEEKSTGVIEVLLSHVRARDLMAGKVFGIGTVALVQFSAAVVAGIVSLNISGIDVPSETWVGLPVTVVWFLGGFLLYSTLFALAGSFVSRVEDAQGAAAPITAALLVAYLLVFALASDPNSTAARVLSVLPPFAPLLMPLRMVTGAASVIEVVLAAVLLAGGVALMIRLAGSVYARTLLHRGRRLTWREGLRHQTGP